MKYINNEVIDVSIFSEEGNLITELNTLKGSKLSIKDNGNTVFLYLKDALLDEELLKFIGKEEIDSSSDYEKLLQQSKYKTSIVLGRSDDKNVKIIGKGIFTNMEDYKNKNFLFEIPKAKTSTDFTMENVPEPSAFDIVFQVYSYNDEGDKLKLHIE